MILQKKCELDLLAAVTAADADSGGNVCMADIVAVSFAARRGLAGLQRFSP